jgi:hypothetical protein
VCVCDDEWQNNFAAVLQGGAGKNDAHTKI